MMLILLLALPVFAQDAAPTGSLWDESQTRSLIGVDANARRVGDLVTVDINEAMASQLSANTETDRESSVNSGITSFLGLQNRLGTTGGLSIEAGAGAAFDGSGSTGSEGRLQAHMTCTVVEVFANGNLRIHGNKEVMGNREVQTIELDGIIRPRDIRMDNTIESKFIANAQIHYTGEGVVSDKQGPGVAHRVLDVVTPF